jgi:hypothetical protein
MWSNLNQNPSSKVQRIISDVGPHLQRNVGEAGDKVEEEGAKEEDLDLNKIRRRGKSK